MKAWIKGHRKAFLGCLLLPLWTQVTAFVVPTLHRSDASTKIISRNLSSEYLSPEDREFQVGLVRQPFTNAGKEPPVLHRWATRDKYRKRATKKYERGRCDDADVDEDDSFAQIQSDTGSEIQVLTPREFLRIRNHEPERFKTFNFSPKNFCGSTVSFIGLSSFPDGVSWDDRILEKLKEQCGVHLVAREEDEDPSTFYIAKLSTAGQQENSVRDAVARIEDQQADAMNDTCDDEEEEESTQMEVESMSNTDEDESTEQDKPNELSPSDRLLPVSDIVVSYYDLPKIRQVFPNMKIHRFEHFEDSFTTHYHGNDITPMIREKVENNQLLSLVGDRDLFDGLPIDEVDASVVVHALSDLMRLSLLEMWGNECASRMWVGCKKNFYGFWYRQGERVEPGTFPDDPVRTVVVTGWEQAHRTLRLEKKITPTESLVEVARGIAEMWPYLHLCGWTEKRSAKIVVIQQDREDAPLVDPGDEWMQPLPVSVEEFAEMIDKYGKDTTKMVVEHSKNSKYGSLHCEIYKIWEERNFDPYYNSATGKYDLTDRFQVLYNEGSECIVFYCNHSSSASPADAENYHKWLREKYPESRQKVYVLDGGLGAFSTWAARRDEFDKYFSSGYW